MPNPPGYTRCCWIHYVDHKGDPDQCEDDALPGEAFCRSHLAEYHRQQHAKLQAEGDHQDYAEHTQDP